MKLGIIGTSWISKQFVDAISTIADYKLTAVYSRKLETAKNFICDVNYDVNTVKATTDLNELFEMIDVVYIASPNSLHYEQAKMAILAGVHVIVEKPSFSTPQEFKAIKELLAQKPDVYFLEAARHIHQENFKQIQKVVENWGKVDGATLVFQKYSSKFNDYVAGNLPNVLNPKFSAGALYDLGVYPLYAAIALFGKPNKVAYFPQLLRSQADGSGTAILEYSGYNVTILCGKNTNYYFDSEILNGEKTLRISNIAELEEVQLVEKKQITDLTKTVDQNPMYQEARIFLDLMLGHDDAKYQQLLALAEDVNQVLYDLRMYANIKFDADNKK